MQDKELDELFRSGLDNMEVQPSAKVWGDINAALGARKRKKLLPYLSVAASIVVLFTAGVLLIPQKQNNPVKRPLKPATIPVTQQPPVADDHTDADTPAPAQTQTAATTPPAVVDTKKQLTGIINGPVKQTVGSDTSATSTIAAVSLKQPEVIKAVAPADDPQLKTTVPQAALTAKPAMAVTAPVIPVQNADAAPVRKKHHLSSFGDMVNAVVAKIDKRKDKFIEFSNTDGDESTITAVNLGIVKISKLEK